MEQKWSARRDYKLKISWLRRKLGSTIFGSVWSGFWSVVVRSHFWRTASFQEPVRLLTQTIHIIEGLSSKPCLKAGGHRTEPPSLTIAVPHAVMLRRVNNLKAGCISYLVSNLVPEVCTQLLSFSSLERSAGLLLLRFSKGQVRQNVLLPNRIHGSFSCHVLPLLFLFMQWWLSSRLW
jgi:hypothetical protein